MEVSKCRRKYKAPAVRCKKDNPPVPRIAYLAGPVKNQDSMVKGKNYGLTILFALCILLLQAQETDADSLQLAQRLYKDAMQQVKAKKYEAAIPLFMQSLAYKNDEPVVWMNLGVAKAALRLHEQALPDFDKAIALNPGLKNAYVNRGFSRAQLTAYKGAIADFTFATVLDPRYGEAWYNRGHVFEVLGQLDSACNDYRRALQFGLREASLKVQHCKDSSPSIQTHALVRLTKTAESAQYGFTTDQPVQIGTGPDGGPANERRYLDLLRDAQGLPVSYEYLGSCCPYASKNGFMGTATLDKYKLTYRDGKDKESSTEVYFTFYDYSEPLILQGFKTVQAPQ